MLRSDWKKNLLRVKQLADQNLGRADRTEVLSDELLDIERRVEVVKQACKATHTKLAACMQGHGDDADRRKRKMPEFMLGQSMGECASTLGTDSLLGEMFALCGEVERSMADAHVDYEMAVETQVMCQVNTILEVDIPHIFKIRKQLTKLTLDMDSARARYQSAHKQTHTGGNAAVAKADNIREEMEDAETRVEQLKDQVATDMYNFVAQEAEQSALLVALVRAQAAYHRQSLELLDQALPAMTQKAETFDHVPVFGESLEEHLERSQRDVAMVIEDCVLTLIEIGMQEEGLFRVTGASSKTRRLKAGFDAGMVDMADFVRDLHCIAGALKLYLRELPEPLLTHALYADWMSAAHLPTHEQRMQAYWLVLDKLPRHNYNNLRYLIKFLALLTDQQEHNKMSGSNLAIVMGPNLLWPPGEDGPCVATTGTQSCIVEALITHHDYFFPGDIDFSLSGSNNSPTPSVGATNSCESPATTVTGGLALSATFAVTSLCVAVAGGAVPDIDMPVTLGDTIDARTDAIVLPSLQTASALTSSTGNLSDSSDRSPKPGRRTLRKSQAPAPPPSERQCASDKKSLSKPAPSTTTAAHMTASSSLTSPAVCVSPPADEHERPPLPDKPTSPGLVQTMTRPVVPPPGRPSGPPPDKPKHSRTGSEGMPPPRAASQPPDGRVEKPDVPAQPLSATSTLNRSGSFRPKRPNAPPPVQPKQDAQPSVKAAESESSNLDTSHNNTDTSSTKLEPPSKPPSKPELASKPHMPPVKPEVPQSKPDVPPPKPDMPPQRPEMLPPKPELPITEKVNNEKSCEKLYPDLSALNTSGDCIGEQTKL